MCKISLSTQRSQVVKIKCQTSNQPGLSLYTTGLGQGIKLSWRLSQQSLIVALVILGILPDLTGVASISPAHRKLTANHQQKGETAESQLRQVFVNKKQASGISGSQLTTANNYSLAILSAEWNGRTGTSKEASLPWKSPLYSDFYIVPNKDQSATKLTTNGNVSKDKRPHSKLVETNFDHAKRLHEYTTNGDNLNLFEVNERILHGETPQNSDSNELRINNDKGRNDQISSCLNCVGSNSLSFPSHARTSPSILSKLKPSKSSTPTRLRRSSNTNEKFSDNKHRAVNYHDRKRKHFSNKAHHSTKKRNNGLSSPLIRHHGTGSIWWWKLIRQNRPDYVDLISGTPLPEVVARSTYKGTGHHSRYSSYGLSPLSSWSNSSLRGVRSIDHGTVLIPSSNSSHNRKTCLLKHGMYDAKGETIFESVVEDGRLKEAMDWEWEICCQNDIKISNSTTKQCKNPDMTLEQRVNKLLKGGLAGMCEHHLVCEILSPVDLHEIGSNNFRTCSMAVKRWWKVFHRLFVSIRNFEEIYQPKFDLLHNSLDLNRTTAEKHKTTYNFTKCKVSPFKPLL